MSTKIRIAASILALGLLATTHVSARVGAWSTEEQQILDLTERLQPHDLLFAEASLDSSTNVTVASVHQFFHLHHMKTGGTSINQLLSCALNRARRKTSSTISFYSLSECSASSYRRCISDPSDRCRKPIANSAAMTYCAPLFQTNQLEWHDADAITVLRHPVDRVWSMFRFQTRGCYQCRNLTDIYADIDKQGGSPDETKANICLPQLVNHQTRNLLTSPQSQNLTDDDKMEEAIRNLWNRFTVIGLTDQLAATVQMIGHAFPWMAEHVEGDDPKQDCPLPHANASPSNNHCGPGNTHWDLPDEPDKETRRAILEHNQLDLKLYEAAVERFELQKRALGWDEEEGRR